ncbi:hybrid sensor histidine kinase/response regulator [Bacilliculturomica massiliensis]|uniref:hybrid sensor histidine kinase/response regulator n=1 Tax=Bacilliculturomica massiliensis TaxID=1917867 RepID=UPI001030A0CF|nr:hybrid sensor histidine kinase/response regulator [Bacilliculturomica massiliensis]
MEENRLSLEQLTAVLDNVPAAVFVSAVNDRRLLYVNRLARELFPKADMAGAACHTVAGFDRVCPFCRTGKMSRSELLVREYRHPVDHRVYQLSGKLIDWAGEEAHIEYILDITDRKLEEERLKKSEQEMAATFDNIACGLCIYQIEGNSVIPRFHNQAFFEIMGISEEYIRRVERENKYLNVHPEDLDLLKQKMDAVFQKGGTMRYTCRLWNDKRKDYRWIHLEGTIRTHEDGRKLFYVIYSDVSEQERLKKELTSANEKMEDIVNAIPGGVAIYRVSDIFETVYFSDGVAELSGYTAEEYRGLIKGDAVKLTYPEDSVMVAEKLRKAIRDHSAADFKFRKQHRDGHVVWVHIQARQIGEENGLPLLQCVFHNISALEETRRELDHLINSIPGGIVSYRVENGQFIPTFFTDSTAELSGFTREEYEKMLPSDALQFVYEQDQPRVRAAALAAVESGEVLDISYRTRHRNGNLVWIHLNGRRMGPRSEPSRFYAVLTNMLADVSTLAGEKADSVFVIDKDTFELLYVNESKQLNVYEEICAGKTCYGAIHGLEAACSFCPLKTFGPDEQEHEITVEKTGLVYTTRVKESVWNGIPAYIMYLRDVTAEVRARREKERLELYFQTLIKNLPGGIAVIRCTTQGGMTPEYISEGLAAMLGMTVEETEERYRGDVFAGLHPEDAEANRIQFEDFIRSGEEHCEMTARFRRGDGSYVWIRDHISLLKGADGTRRLYCVYTDVGQLVAEKEQMGRQYEEMILQHYRTPGPDTLILGHCNITRNQILDVRDFVDSGLSRVCRGDREEFFTGLAGLITDEEERRTFLETYLNAPSMESFERGNTEQIQTCFIRLPGEDRGRYVTIQINMVQAPDTGDITGILSVSDVTDQVISEQILRRLSVTSHDYVVDLDLGQDSYTLLTRRDNASQVPPSRGRYSERVAFMVESVVVPRDREAYARALAPEEMERRLRKNGLYTFGYSIEDERGEIRAKNITVSAIDLRIGRASLVCTDITGSVREQQNLLSMLAYTFELAGIIDIRSGRFVMYTRQMILENLPPYISYDYQETQKRFAESYVQESRKEARIQFCLETMIHRLGETPAGYEFVLPFQGEGEDGLRYKQINVLWGDRSRETICMVRADVTEVLAAERQAKSALEKALASAREANRAKSDFLSAMSHDIRTPMNAIMGMTTLAPAHLDDRVWMEDCLRKISISSKHLLSLVNDVLDMSRIERGQLTLNPVPLSITELTAHLSVMMEPQVKAAEITFAVRTEGVCHQWFYGDSLRIDQTLINLLGNAVKFTPEGGRVDFIVEELPPADGPDRVRYRFTVSDTGIGMSEEFLKMAFEPFARDDGTARIEGTGLGLSIVRGLVELMGGLLSVESRRGSGSVFRVELEFPAAPEKNAPSADALRTLKTGGGEPFSGLRFLVAEDNDLNAEILCEILQRLGARIVVKPDGVQAVRAFQEADPGTYAAVLMDIQMPNMNGYQASRAIRSMERPDAGEIPIVALTADAFAEDVRAAAEAGMTAHVSKPVDVAVLQATLSRILGR